MTETGSQYKAHGVLMKALREAHEQGKSLQEKLMETEEGRTIMASLGTKPSDEPV